MRPCDALANVDKTPPPGVSPRAGARGRVAHEKNQRRSIRSGSPDPCPAEVPRTRNAAGPPVRDSEHPTPDSVPNGPVRHTHKRPPRSAVYVLPVGIYRNTPPGFLAGFRPPPRFCQLTMCQVARTMGVGSKKQGVFAMQAMRVVGYIRVSSEDQARDGVSLDAQREKVRLFAELHGLDLAEVVTDAAVSAKTLDRPGLSRVLAMLDAGEVGGVIVWKLDRLTRHLGDWSHLIDHYFGEQAGRSLMSVSESIDTRTAAGRMVLNIMMTVAQWERETIVERTRSAMQFKRSRGERISRRLPYGARLADDGRTLIAAPDETAAAAEAAALQAAGWSLRRIAAELARRGVPTKTGCPWTFSGVRSLLKRPA